MDESHRRAGGVTVLAPFAVALVVFTIAAWMRPRLAARHPVASRSAAPRRVRRRRRPMSSRRRRRQIAVQFPDLIDLFIATVRAGFTPLQAIEQVGPIAPDVFQPALGRVTQRVTAGALFAEAVAELPTQLGPAALGLADSLALADRYGLPLTPILDRLGDEARAHRRRNAEAAARQLPIRLSFPLVCCTLPSFVLLSIVPLLAGTISSLRDLQH